jgi:hypothetical protein
MKKVLLLMVAVLMISSVAMADHVGMYNDQAGTSCLLAPGFDSGTYGFIIHKFSVGATGVRFKVNFPAGSAVFAFTPSGAFSALGVLTSDMSVGYGGCQNSGAIVVGSIVASLAPGAGAVVAADLQTSVVFTDCGFTQKDCTGGTFTIGASGSTACTDPNATEPTTWGSVKALYR